MDSPGLAARRNSLIHMIVRWSTGSAGDNMSEDILTDLTGVVPRHPWFQARARLAVALLRKLSVFPPARVLEAGCGWGVNLAALEQAGYRSAGLDISRRSLEQLDRPGRELIEADLTQPVPADVEQYDAVMALDVVEHLDDDRSAVARLAHLTKPGGVVVVGVPALPELFSEFDAVQGHRRRYVPDSLREAFTGSGLIVERVLWWGGWMLPLVKRQRRPVQAPSRRAESAAETYRRYLRLPPWPAPLAMRVAFALDEGRTLRGASRIGTSLFALARRPPASVGNA